MKQSKQQHLEENQGHKRKYPSIYTLKLHRDPYPLTPHCLLVIGPIETIYGETISSDLPSSEKQAEHPAI